jgi:hypothetical protein
VEKGKSEISMHVNTGRQWLFVASISVLISGLIFGPIFGAHQSLADTPKSSLNLASNEKAVEQVVAVMVLQDIYAKIGLTASVEPLPGMRANKLAVNGQKDGEVARITPYAPRHPPLVRVDPPYYYLTTAVFVKKAKRSKFRPRAIGKAIASAWSEAYYTQRTVQPKPNR